VFVFCSDLQEFPGLVWCRGKRFFRERGRRRTAATVAGGGGAAAGDFGNLLISFWRFIPELASKVLACAERKKKERRKLRKREGFGKRYMVLGGK
jgi:hypothetical protein